MTGRVAGKVVLVTGAGQGQGAAEAAALAREGAVVVGLDVREPPVPVAGVEHRTLDVSSEDEWAALQDGSVSGSESSTASSTTQAWAPGRLGEITLADLNRIMAVNLNGSLFGIQALVAADDGGRLDRQRLLDSRRHGHFAPAYSASKWAVRGISRAASMELGRIGIRVNTIFRA